jgi:hypothetical protein
MILLLVIAGIILMTLVGTFIGHLLRYQAPPPPATLESGHSHMRSNHER